MPDPILNPTYEPLPPLPDGGLVMVIRGEIVVDGEIDAGSSEDG